MIIDLINFLVVPDLSLSYFGLKYTFYTQKTQVIPRISYIFRIFVYSLRSKNKKLKSIQK